MLDLRQLSYFVAVAEEEHVGRAAVRLHMSQSPLSRQIAQLEDMLGLVLFERIQQRIRLTREGRAFLAETRLVLMQAQRLEALGRSLGCGTDGELHIGYVEKAVHAGILPAGLRGVREREPAVRVGLHSLRAGSQLLELRQRSLDIGIVGDKPAPEYGELAAARVFGDPVVLALCASHPLCVTPLVSPADLRGHQWIGAGFEDGASGRDDFVGACARAGFHPRFEVEAGDPATALGLVAAGLGMAMVPQGVSAHAPSGVVLRAVPWLRYRISLWIVWHRANTRPLVTLFRKTLLENIEESTHEQ
jgi:DNA-binding transcriptional LysR family regulator